MNAVLKFLMAARSLAKQGVKKNQILNFAEREFGEVPELLKRQIDGLFKERSGGITGIKQQMDKIKGLSDDLKKLEDERFAIYGKKTETPGQSVRKQTMGTKEYYLEEMKHAYPNEFKRLTGKETTEDLKEMIRHLDEEGIPFASGGRIGFHRGSLRHQKEHDYKALEKKGNLMRYLMLSGDRAMMSSPENPLHKLLGRDERWKYHQILDDFETWQKERFMYGEHKQPNVFKETWKEFKDMYENIKGARKGKASGGIAGQLHLYEGGRARVGMVGGGAAWKKFIEMLFIKSSNNIRQGKGLFKGLTDKQRIVQHDNLTTLAEKFRKTGKFDEGANQYFGIDAEKAFAAAETKATRLGKRGPHWTEKEVKAQMGEIATGTDETTDLFNFKKILPEELRNSLNQLPDEGQIPLLKKFKQAFEATKTGGIEAGVDVLQKELLAGFKPTGKPHAAGGRIGFSKGKGLSWLWKLLKEPKTSLYSREKANPLGPSLFETVAGDTSRRTFLKKLMLNDERMKRIKFKQMLKDATDEARRNPGYKFPSDKQVKEEIERIFAEAYSPHFTKHAAGGLAKVLGV